MSQIEPASGSSRGSRQLGERADVVVVGSGFGGAVSACRLSQAGLDVVILERGRRYEHGDFPPLPSSDELLPDTRRWLWGPEHGLWDVEDLGEITSVTAAGYGGGSLIYANVHLRPPRTVFDERWPEAYRGRGGLDEYFDLAASMLEVRPLPEGELRPKSAQFEQAASALGREPFRPPLAISRQNGPNVHGVDQRACNSCGACCTGCPIRAKNTLDLNYLAIAERHGARARTQCEVIDLEQQSDEAWVVHYVDHFEATKKRIVARHVFLCAGSTHSTRLLLRWDHKRLARRQSGAQRYSAASNSLIGVGFSPGGDAVGVVYDTDRKAAPSRGPTITTSVVQWQDSAKGRFFLLQDGGYAEQLARLVGTLRAPLWVGRNRLTRSPNDAREHGPNRSSKTGRSELPSVLDQVLDASSSRLLDAALRGHRQDLLAFVKEAQAPALLPDVVERTVELAVIERYARGLLTGWIREDSRLMKWLVGIDKWVLHRLYGGFSALSDHAAAALLSGGGRSRQQLAQRVLGYDDTGAEYRLMLLAMGRDAAPGLLEYDPEHDRLIADLDLYHLVPGYSEQERLMADFATTLGGELRTNPAWSFLGKPITVHNQGGCPMSDEPDEGVTDANGKVHGVEGLYVMDAALFCTSVGVNPSATIAAIAERNVLAFINAHERFANGRWPDAYSDDGAREYARQRQSAEAWAERAKSWQLEPPATKAKGYRARPLGITFAEEMRGYVHTTDDLLLRADGSRRDPRSLTDDEYLMLERRGRPEYPVCAKLVLRAPSLARFIEDERHRLWIEGTVELRLPGEKVPKRRTVTGHLELFVRRRKPYALTEDQSRRRRAQRRLSGIDYGAVPDDARAPAPVAEGDEQFMLYALDLDDAPGWRMTGFKRLSDKPGPQAWRDVSCLYVKLWRPDDSGKPSEVVAAGAVRVDLVDFLSKQVPSIQATGSDDPARRVWAAGRFASYFFGTLQRVYFPEFNAAVESLFGTNSAKLERGLHSPYFSDSVLARDLDARDSNEAEAEKP